MRDIRTMLTLVHHGETLVALKLFAQPMDRAEVLHTPKYDICGSWKILLAKTIRFFHPKIQLFQKVRLHLQLAVNRQPGSRQVDS